eukprot:700943-Pleurochrysis_carterae.AAC.1
MLKAHYCACNASQEWTESSLAPPSLDRVQSLASDDPAACSRFFANGPRPRLRGCRRLPLEQGKQRRIS